MANDALEFATDNTDFTDKMNRKSVFVGTGAQINSIVTPYPGQYALCTLTGSGFTADTIYERDSTNTIWILKKLLGSVAGETSEYSNETAVPNLQTTMANSRRYLIFTLPTTEKYYIITGIEWKNGSVAAGNTMAGVDLLNADPPTLNGVSLVAITSQVANTGNDAIQRNSRIVSNLIRGGIILGAWISIADSAQNYWYSSGTQYAKTVTYSSSPPNHNNDAFITSNVFYIKVYYRGYSPN